MRLGRILAWCWILGAVGCQGELPLRLKLPRYVQRPERAAVVYFVDGMDQSRLRDLLDAGELPNIQRRFVEGGVEATAIVSLPPITYPNTASLLTGLGPARHGIVGNSWFDPEQMIHRDYRDEETYQLSNSDLRGQTIFELLGDQFTVNVQCHTRRGAKISFDNRVTNGIDYVMKDFISIDRRTGRTLEDVARAARRAGRWPTLIWFYFPGVDEIGHHDGVTSERYAEALRNVDAQIGRTWSALEQAGLASQTYFALVTDHGHVPSRPEKTLELAEWIEDERHMRVLRVDREEDLESDEIIDRYHAIAMIGADRCCALHLRSNEGWGFPASTEHIESVVFGGSRSASLLDQPAIGLVCLRGPANKVRVLATRGQAVIERRGEGRNAEYLYTVPAGGADPLGYLESPAVRAFVETGWRRGREWLTATIDTDYPDFVPQIAELMQSPRSGDVILFAASDWTFRENGHGGHGSALARDARVAFYFAGPGLPAGARTRPARVVDVMPTLLDLLGESARLEQAGAIDGVSIAPALRAARPTP